MPKWPSLLLCVAGAAMIFAGLRQSMRGRDTRTWTRTQGRILASYVEEIPGPAEAGGPQFRPVVRYGYEARGRAYQSERVSLATSAASTTSDRAEAQRPVERYPVGSGVDVWIDPGDPSQAVLVRGVPPAQVAAAVAIGIGLFGIGLLALAR